MNKLTVIISLDLLKEMGETAENAGFIKDEFDYLSKKGMRKEVDVEFLLVKESQLSSIVEQTKKDANRVTVLANESWIPPCEDDHIIVNYIDRKGDTPFNKMNFFHFMNTLDTDINEISTPSTVEKVRDDKSVFENVPTEDWPMERMSPINPLLDATQDYSESCAFYLPPAAATSASQTDDVESTSISPIPEEYTKK